MLRLIANFHGPIKYRNDVSKTHLAVNSISKCNLLKVARGCSKEEENNLCLTEIKHMCLVSFLTTRVKTWNEILGRRIML